MGSALYKKGIRWTEYMESKSIIGKHDEKYMVLDCILTISSIILLVFMKTSTISDHPVTLVMLIITIIHISGAWS